jgi:hypothetical protein
MDKGKVTMCVWWMEHSKLKGVRTAVLFEALYDVDGDLVGGAAHSVGVSKIGCPGKSLECPERWGVT